MPMTPNAGIARWQTVVLWTALLMYAQSRIWQMYPEKIGILPNVLMQVVPPAVFALVHGSILYGIRGMSVFTGFCLGVAAICESLSLRTGFPFGHYFFTDFMGPKVTGLPILLVLAYLGIGYCSWVLGLLILGYRDKPLAGTRVVVLPLLASGIMLGCVDGPDLVNTRSGVDLARWRRLLRRAFQQLLRLVPYRVSLLSELRTLLQGPGDARNAALAQLLAHGHRMLRSVRVWKPADLPCRLVSGDRDRRRGQAVGNDEHSDCVQPLCLCWGWGRQCCWRGIGLRFSKPDSLRTRWHLRSVVRCVCADALRSLAPAASGMLW
jgi:hypothetical protein